MVHKSTINQSGGTPSSISGLIQGGTGITLTGGGTAVSPYNINSVWTQSGNNIYNNNTGNVGIGTSTPGRTLSLNSSGQTYLTINSPAIEQVALEFTKAGVSKWIEYIPSSSNDLRFYDGADRVTFQSGGNVGIGTTSPAAPLQIMESSNQNLILDTSSGSNQVRYTFRRQGADKALVYMGGDDSLNTVTIGNNPIIFAANNGGGATLTLAGGGNSYFSGGNVGIGVSNPARHLEVFDSSNPQLRLTQMAGSKYIDFLATNLGYLAIDPVGSGGRVGLFTSTPTHALDVASGGSSDGIINAGFGYYIGGTAGVSGTGNNFTAQSGIITSVSTASYVTGAAGSSGDVQINNAGAFAGVTGVTGSGNNFTASGGIITNISTASYLTTISGLNISQLTNDSGYLNSAGVGSYLTSNNYATQSFVTSQGYITTVSPGGSNGSVQYNNAGSLGGASSVFITTSGLGVGVSTSSYPLEVSGNINATNYYAGGTAPVADGTYQVGLGLTTNGTITTKGGIVTAVQQAS